MRGWYFLLFLIYLALDAAGYIDVPQAPWLKDLSKWSPVPIALLLFILVHRGAELINSLREARATSDQLKADLDEMARLKESVESMRQQIRSSDALLHGKLLFYQQKYKEAASAFNEVVQEEPNNPQNRYWLGLCLLRAGNARDALPHLTEAAETSEDEDPEFLATLGEAEFKLRKPKLAEVHLQKAYDAGISNKESTLLLISKVQRQQDEPERAIATLRKIIDINPYNGNAITELAEILIAEEDYDQAITECDKALTVHSRNWSVYPIRAEALLLRDGPGDQDKATKDLKTASWESKRDYNIYRVEGEDLTRRALAESNIAEREKLLHKAVEVYKKGAEVIPGGHKAPLYAAQSFVYIVLGRPAEAEDSAQMAVKAYPESIRNHLALCSALLTNRRWTKLQRAAYDARDVGGRPGRIYSHIYVILAALFAGDRIEDFRQEIQDLMTELKTTTTFKPQRRDWQYIRQTVGVESLSNKERELGTSIVEYLDGTKDRDEFLRTLERLVA